jgi:hypothetical protein
MKRDFKYILVLAFFIGISGVWGQEKYTDEEIGFDRENITREILDKNSEEYKNYKGTLEDILQQIRNIYVKNHEWAISATELQRMPPPLNSTCVNMDFSDNNFNGWCRYTNYGPISEGTISDTISHFCDPNEEVNDDLAGIPSFTTTQNVPEGNSRFEVIERDNFNDFFIGTGDDMPEGVSHVARIGNSLSNGRTDELRQRFTLDSNNSYFEFYYAIVLENPGHTAISMQPKFYTYILVNGEAISCSRREFVANHVPSFQNTTQESLVIQYSGWQSYGIDLSAYASVNDEIEIVVGTFDCGFQQHFAYAYFSAQCGTSDVGISVTSQSGSFCPGEELTFTNEAIGTFNDETYLWTFTDSDGAYTSTEATPTYTFTQPGSYTVDLEITIGSDSCTQLFSREVVIVDYSECEPCDLVDFEIISVVGQDCFDGPQPNLWASKTSQTYCMEETYCFTWENIGVGSLEGLDSILWEFYGSDGEVISTSTQLIPSFGYNVPGQYNIKVTLTFGNGCVQEFIQVVNVENCDPCDDIAILIDESSSISAEEAQQLRAGLSRFIEDQMDSGLNISIIGMSDNDTDSRTDHIIREKVNNSTNQMFLDWISGYGNRYGVDNDGISSDSDYWGSAIDVVNNLVIPPKLVVIFTDGSQTENIQELKNKIDVMTENSHLFVYGIDNEFYVHNGNLAGGADANSNPAYSDVVPSLRTSLEYLLEDYTDVIVESNNNLMTAHFYGYEDFSALSNTETILSNLLAHSNIECAAPIDYCYDCYSFQPEPQKKYWISGWVKEELNHQVLTYEDTSIEITFWDAAEMEIEGTAVHFYPSGNIIEGWQRIAGQFEIPVGTVTLEIELYNDSKGIPAYFDDIRVHPLDGSMKSFVYDPVTYRLMAELDENNYGTYYEYDNEGGLVRVKKETSRGVKTIQETRSGNAIKNNN